MMDWSPLVQALIGLAAAAVPVIAAKLWTFLEERTRALAVTRLGAAAERAAGTVVEAMSDPALGPAVEAAKQAAIDAAVLAMRRTMQGTIGKLNGTPDQIRSMVVGELGKLLAKAR